MFAWIEWVRYLNWVAVQKTIAQITGKRLTGLAAEMAFSAMLGLFPAIIAVLSAISLFGTSVESSFAGLAVHFADIIPIQVWTLLLEFIEDTKAVENKSWFSLGTVSAVWIISGVLTAAINALDRIHQVDPKYRRSYVRTKVVAVSLTILTIAFFVVACFLLWVGDVLLQIALQQNWNSLLLTTWQLFSIIAVMAVVTTTTGLIYQFHTRLRRKSDRELKTYILILIVILATVAIQLIYTCYLTVENLMFDARMEFALSKLMLHLWRWLGFPIALGVVAIAFSLIYRYGASIRIKHTPVFPGAILAAVSWALVSVVFRLYVYHIGIYNKLYGAVGTAIVLMLWLYLSSLVMLIGEQINVVLGEAIAGSKN